MTGKSKQKILIHSINVVLLLILILTYYGKMTFGLGLGDLFLVGVLGLYIIINTSLAIVIEDKFFLTMLLIFTCAILLWSIWGVTFGRGTEYKWNGDVFIK